MANKERKYSVTTIGMYLIRIKAVINGQIEAGLMKSIDFLALTSE